MSILKLFPEVIRRVKLIMDVLRSWVTRESTDSFHGDTTLNCLVAAIELCNSLLDEGPPDRLIWSRSCEWCNIFSIFVLNNWNEVVNRDCGGEAERVEVQSIYASVIVLF